MDALQFKRAFAKALKAWDRKIDKRSRKRKEVYEIEVHSAGLTDLQPLLKKLASQLSRTSARLLIASACTILMVALVGFTRERLQQGVAEGRGSRLASRLNLPSLGVVPVPQSSGREAALIPHVIHQMVRTQAGHQAIALQHTWMHFNPGWEVRQWHDADCISLVETHLPSYFQAYVASVSAEHRALWCQFLVAQHHGGIVADARTECMQPLDRLIMPSSGLLAGWHVADAAAATDIPVGIPQVRKDHHNLCAAFVSRMDKSKNNWHGLPTTPPQAINVALPMHAAR